VSLEKTRYLLILAFCFSLPYAKSQDLSKVGNSKPIKLSGAISTNQIFYHALGLETYRDPYSFFMNGNLNFDLYGLSVPLSFSYSNQQGEFRQPFNQYGMSPTYKWVTGHIGYRTLNFSNYTLAGHIFLGVGIEVDPPSTGLRASMMYGRLRQAIAEDTTGMQTEEPSYARIGYGAKVGYGKNGDYIDCIVFRAKDNEQSIVAPVSETLTPQENLVLGVNINKQLFKKITLTGEYATSALTRDTRDEAGEPSSVFGSVGPLFSPKSSTTYHKAYKVNVSYPNKVLTLQLGFEHIDPGYNTLGAYFFNDDLENMTLGLTKRLLKDKLSLAVNGGLQRNNLKDTELTTTKRWIASANVAYAVSERLNLTSNYSNFSVFTRIKSNQIIDTLQQIDSLRYLQVTQNASFSANYNAGTKEKKSSIGLTASLQVANDQSSATEGNDTKFYSGNIYYRLMFVPKDLSFTSGVNTNINESSSSKTLLLGPSFGINKSFFKKKLRTSWNTSLNNVWNAAALSSRVWTMRLNNTYVYAKRHNLSLGVSMTNKFSKGASAQKFTEFNGSLTYSYSFNVIK